MKTSLVFAPLIVAFLPCAHAFGTINIDTVPVGNVGNPNDPATGNQYGGVHYSYSIGKYEVTLGQYTAFLNAVAATDTYSLYYPGMAGTKIARTGVSGAYSYSTIGSPNYPICLVSWGSAARFANWLHNGQPTGAQDNGTTEDGAYTLNGTTSRAGLNAITRNANARWFIPTENEWYKAAYHQPASQGGDTDNYWNYPMRTNSVPYSDQPPGATPDNTRVGNFPKSDGLANGYDDGYAVTGSTNYSSSQNYLTDVGAYSSSPSFYGTFDQGGNVWEWNETLGLAGAYRRIRGGSWFIGVDYMPASYQNIGVDPTLLSGDFGFRVATVVPEPSTMGLVALAVTGLGFYRRAPAGSRLAATYSSRSRKKEGKKGKKGQKGKKGGKGQGGKGAELF